MDSSTSTPFRPTTSSTTSTFQIDTDGSSNHGWSFLHNHHSNDPNTSPRSLPPSTYIRSSNSASSRSPHQNYSSHSQTLSRSLLNQFSTSTGHRSIATNPSLPSQPVLLRINSNNAYTHTSHMPRRSGSGRPIRRDKATQLPAPEEFSIQGILSAISEDIEDDLAVISEVLGRSRFVLADQHESQMAPLGEIRGIDIIGEEELQRSGDDVMILREDASLVDGSNSGSAAYGLLERLQAVPRTGNVGNADERATLVDIVPVREELAQTATGATDSVPTSIIVEVKEVATSRPDGPARAVVSETYVSAEADRTGSGMFPTVSEPGRQYLLYFQAATEPLQSASVARESTSPARRQSIIPGIGSITSWLSRNGGNDDLDAEATLRGLLNR